MHCQWGKKTPKIAPSTERPSHGDRQHAQKFGKDRACGSGDMFADRQTDTQIHTDTPPMPRAK